MENEVMYIKLDDIIPNRFQPREVFDEEALNKLAESIKQHGVIEPILVRPVSNKYEIIAGERRYKASVLAGLTKIPAMVKKLDDKESSIVAFIENEHRSDVSAIEEARTMDRILQSNAMTQEELAKELGVNQSTIANKLRLLNLPLEVQESLMRNEISERHARSLLSVKQEEKQLELLRKIKEKRMTVRELDSEIKNMNENMYDNQINNVVEEQNINPIPQEPVIKTPGFMDFSGNPSVLETPQPKEPDFMSFLNNNTSAEPQIESPAPEPPKEPELMSFLNINDNPNPTPLETPAPEIPSIGNELPTPEFTELKNDNITVPEPPKEPDFMSFLNNNTSAEPQIESPAPTTQEEPDFMSFLNNYDANNPLPEENTSVGNELPTPEFTEVKNDNITVPETPQEPDFMSFLNNNTSAEPQTESPAPTAQEEPDFMSFLNNYEPSVPTETPLVDTPVTTPDETLNTFESPVTPEIPSVPASENPNLNEVANNVVINDVTPPITTDFNTGYVENNPNFVDITKEAVIDNVDVIIDKLKDVIEEIKTNSKFKVETDEINFDDRYQITITIDKRDF